MKSQTITCIAKTHIDSLDTVGLAFHCIALPWHYLSSPLTAQNGQASLLYPCLPLTMWKLGKEGTPVYRAWTPQSFVLAFSGDQPWLSLACRFSRRSHRRYVVVDRCYSASCLSRLARVRIQRACRHSLGEQGPVSDRLSTLFRERSINHGRALLVVISYGDFSWLCSCLRCGDVIMPR